MIRKAIEVLNNGGVILYPTDTIPGLGCDATNEEAAQKIFEIKNRPAQKSFIVLVSSDAMLQKYVSEIPEIAWDIIDYAEKPTTIIYPNARNLAPSIMAEDGSIGIRMVKFGEVHRLIHQFGKPLVSTSANLSGEPSPTDLSEINTEISSKVDLIVDLPNIGNKVASSIIKIELNGEFKIIRK